ncbi:MAG: efflux RND transporter periplasmic adaptor subunit, partial [Lentisphaerota bacterium]
MKKSIAIAVGVGLLAGFVMGRGCVSRQPPTSAPEAESIQTAAKAEIWTCSMHPQIRQPKPGKCPICGMDLILVATDSSSDTDQLRQIALSPEARKLAEIAVAPVERRSVAVEIRMAGKVQFDETHLAYIAPRVSGRIDRLYANYNGMPVKPGDHLADMYSPELVSAQQELLQALKAAGGEASTATLLNATRERLR